MRCTQGRRRSAARSSAAVLVTLGLLATGLTLLLTTSPPAVAADPSLPPDKDPGRPGTQLTVPYYSEPEFLLLSGEDRWNVRNRPAGTVAAGYGHEDDAIADVLTASARYDQVSQNPFPIGTTSPDRQRLDVAVLQPTEDRTVTWVVTRFDDSSVEIQGPLEHGLKQKFTLGVSAYAPDGYVGGTVLADGGPGDVALLMVQPNGDLHRWNLDVGEGLNPPTVVGNVGGAAAAAISRSYSAFDTSPRGLSITDRVPSRSSTLLLVLRDDGQLVPARIGFFTDGPDPEPTGFEILAPLSSLNGALASFNVPQDPLIDFDFSCVQLDRVIDSGGVTGAAAGYLGCGTGTANVDGSLDRLVLGRISVAVTTDGVQPLRMFTAADYASEDDRGFWSIQPEYRADSGCDYVFSPPGAAPGSFDLRTTLGVTHLACVETDFEGDLAVTDVTQPVSQQAFQAHSDTILRGVEFTSTSAPIETVGFDRMHQPAHGTPSTGEVPLIRETYSDVSHPTIQLQFPCAQLLARPSRAGSFLDDCDLSMPAATPPGQQAVAPPWNWKSYTIAAYASPDSDGSARRLLVTTSPADTSPGDRRLRDNTSQSPYGPTYDKANFAWSVEPAAYLASDIEDLHANPDADINSYDVYAAPPQAEETPLLLAQVPRPARTTVLLDIPDQLPHLETSPSAPVAILQAPPQVEGLGQQDSATPAFAAKTSDETSSTVGKSSRLGTSFGLEASFMGGAGGLGNKAITGAGFEVGFEFNNEVGQELQQAIEVAHTEAYGGSLAYDTVVTRAIKEHVWEGTVLRDPWGLATGAPFTYRLPAGEVTKSIPLPQLQADSPALYGPSGLFGPSISRILGGAKVGDPGSYLRGADQPQPTSLVEANGGPCRGGYTERPGDLTPFTGDLPAAVSLDNPYIAASPPAPYGPNILVSNEHVVSVGNDLTEGAVIGLTDSASRSKMTSKSFDFSASALLKTETEVQLGAAAKVELEVNVGIQGGFSESAGISDTLATGSELSAFVGNIPHTVADTGPWLNQEGYSWRMYMCKAQLGPSGVSLDVWVQGYVTNGYAGAGGVTDLLPVEAVQPVRSSVVLADPEGTPSATTMECTTAEQDDANRFRWNDDAGTTQSYELQMENISTGDAARHVIAEWATPSANKAAMKQSPSDNRIGVAPRPDCADVSAANFVDGDLYRWRMVVDGFVVNQKRSEWEFLRPQVWPPAQQLSLRTPVVNPDYSATIDIVDPGGVESLRHDVTIRGVGSPTVVTQGVRVRNSWRSPSLPPGNYVAEVVGYNGHELPGGGRAETPAETVTFKVSEKLTAQFEVTGCGGNPCTTAGPVTFVDRSTSSGSMIETWAWDFGDGATSTNRNPQHHYAAPSSPGGYDVSLTVTDDMGRVDVLVQPLEVFASDGDKDDDGLLDATDNCPNTPNSTQTDTDRDGVGDACDLTPNGDADGDLVNPAVDNCPTVANADQADKDQDGRGDACDTTPVGPSVVRVSVSKPTKAREGENRARCRFPVVLDRPADRRVRLGFRFLDRTARAGHDYRSKTGLIVFEPGQKSKTVRVRILDDDLAERQRERFKIRLFDPDAGVFLATSTAKCVIIDDD